jgi:hypothetical protein
MASSRTKKRKQHNPNKNENSNDDDANNRLKGFPFFANSAMMVACGGPEITNIILSYCEPIVVAFFKLHEFETQERCTSACSEALQNSSDFKTCVSVIQQRMHRHINAYFDFFSAMEANSIENDPDNPQFILDMLADEVETLVHDRKCDNQESLQKCLNRNYQEQFRSIIKDWIHNHKSLHDLPKCWLQSLPQVPLPQVPLPQVPLPQVPLQLANENDIFRITDQFQTTISHHQYHKRITAKLVLGNKQYEFIAVWTDFKCADNLEFSFNVATVTTHDDGEKTTRWELNTLWRNDVMTTIPPSHVYDELKFMMQSFNIPWGPKSADLLALLYFAISPSYLIFQPKSQQRLRDILSGDIMRLVAAAEIDL